MSFPFELKIFYPDMIGDGEVGDYNKAFELWYRIWVETREEVDRGLPTPSDNFSRQSEILALFHGERAVGMICHRYVDLRHAAIMRDSFFSPAIWPEAVRLRLPELGRSCVLGSHVFIDPEFRKNQSGLPTKNLLCALSFSHLNGTAPDLVVGMMRKDKGMHSVFYNCGAETLHADTNWYQIPVDLVAFFPAKRPIGIEPEFARPAAEIGARCHRYGANYFNRKGEGHERNRAEVIKRAG